MNRPFDAGLQPERTALAWRRTCLALLAGSLVAARVLPELFGAWSALIGVAGAVGAGALLAGAHRRYRAHHDDLNRHGDRAPVAGGRMVAALASFAVGAALVSIGAVLFVVLTRVAP